MSIKRSVSAILGLVLALSVLASACGPATTETPEVELPQAPATEAPEVEAPTVEGPEAEEPVTMRIGVLSDVDCWNPFTCVSVWWQETYVLEGLTGHGSLSSGCGAIPELAESWDVSDDGRTWTIKLFDGITFSDGTPYNAETAKWNLEFYANSPSLADWYAETWDLQDITVVDDLTLSYTTGDPIVNSPDYDWQWWVQLSPSVWADVPEEDLYTFEFYPPIGTGPYVISEFVPGSYIVFDARDDYYRGKPPIDRVVFMLYANADAIVNALISGEIDLTTPLMPPESYDILASDPNITVEEKVPYAGILHWLVFNLYEGGIKNPAVDDPAVREAVDYAINKQQIVDVALLGHGALLPTGWVGRTDIELNPELEVTPYDPAIANQILDEAGYLDTDNDGVRETPDGQPLSLRLLYELEFAPALTISNLISDWLRAVGIDVIIEAQESGTWISVVLSDHDFDMAINSDTHDIDAASMDFWFSCWSAESGANALNYPGYCSEEMDALVSEYWFNPDPEARWEPMYQAQKIFADDRPLITLAGQNQIQAYRNDRFELPMDTCDVAYGMFDPERLLEAVVK